MDHVVSTLNETSVPRHRKEMVQSGYPMEAQQSNRSVFAAACANVKLIFVSFSLLTLIIYIFTAFRITQLGTSGNLFTRNSPVEVIGDTRRERAKQDRHKSIASADSDLCFPYGTNKSVSKDSCVCLEGWNGDTCSVPQVIWVDPVFQRLHSQGLVKRRLIPRTIISSFIFNHEMDMLDIRIHVLGDAVDYYVVCETSYTAFGSPKPLYLSSNLSAGFLSEHRHKIILLTSEINFAMDKDPWASENNARSLLWKQGRHRIKNLRDDDLFMIADADEIPSREVMLFLKYHDGYGEPVAFGLRWFLYGFFWENDRPVIVSGVCTVGYLREVYGDDSKLVRKNERRRVIRPSGTTTGTLWTPWTIKGVSPEYAGWHCSWCFSISGIKLKLASSQRDDGIRWGDFAEKHDPEYIRFLRREGRFFDESPPLKSTDSYRAAPAYVVQEEKRWPYLLAV